MPSPARTNSLIAAAFASSLSLMAGTTGQTFWVDSGAGGAGIGQKDSPFLTIAEAITASIASNGDLILVMPGHAESIGASDIALSKAGVTVQGLGYGTNKPTFTMTATGSTVNITAANVTFRNCRLVGDIDNLVAFITIAENYATIEDVDMVTSSTKEALSFISITTTFDFAAIRRCTFWQPTDPAGTNAGAGTGAIYIVDSENVTVEDCQFTGNFETAFIHNKTTAAVNLWVRRCWGICSLADAQPFLLVATATGGADRCSFITPAETATTEATLSGTFGAGFFNFESYFGNDGGGGQLAIASQAAAT